MESSRKRMESTATEECSTKADKIPKRDAPPPLPEGAWAEWGDDAVCFVLPISGEEGLGIFAIDPLGASVYHVVDFCNGPGVSSNAACAFFGSCVYVVSDTGSMWFYDIEGPSPRGWMKGKNLNGTRNGNPNSKLFNSPTMFTFKGSGGSFMSLAGYTVRLPFCQAGTSEPADFVVYSFGVIDHELPKECENGVFMTASLISRTYQRLSGYMFPNGPPREDEFSLQNHSQELSFGS